MYSYMLPKVVFHVKRLVAVVTNITGFRAGYLVDSDHMQLQITSLSRLVTTNSTCVWFFSGMRPVVIFQQIFIREAFRADIALESTFCAGHRSQLYEAVKKLSKTNRNPITRSCNAHLKCLATRIMH